MSNSQTPSQTVHIKITPQVPGLSLGTLIAINKDPDYDGYVSIPASAWELPSQYKFSGVNNLQDLYNKVGAANLTTDYYVGFQGTMYPENCLCTTYLDVTPTGLGNKTAYSQTIFSLGDGKAIALPPGAIPSDKDQVQFRYIKLAMPSSPDILISLSSHTVFSGNTCGTCNNHDIYSQGGGAYILGYVDVYVNMYNYCTMTGTANIYFKPCFNFIGDYCKNSGGCDTKITSYLQDYCNTQYPNAELDIFNTIFDPEDYYICACNMPITNYQNYLNSLTNSQTPPLSITQDAECVFPPCRSSQFKPSTIDGCPGPNCFNAVVLSGNTIDGNVQTNQNADCANYTSDGATSNYTPTQTPGKSSAPSSKSSSPNSAPSSTSSSSWFNQYWWVILIIVIVIILIILLIGGGAVYYKKYYK